MGRTIVVTGAYGFLGRHVARCLSKQGHIVLGIGHGEWLQEDWKFWGLSEWKRSDVTLQALKQYAGEPSAIVHCAGSGSVPFSIQDPLADFERTVETTAHVLEYVRTSAPSCRIVYPSSASVYGNAETIPIREVCPTVPISQYGTHKLMAEQMVTSYSRQFGTSAAIVRLFSVYGCGLRKQLLWDACRKFSNNDYVFTGTGNEVRDLLHVEDAATLLMTATEHASPTCPTVNGGSGHGVTVRDVLLHLTSILQTKGVPTFSGTQRTGDPTRYIADTQGSKAWGWLPTRQWAEGVEEYVTWWKRNFL
ncbi:NAD-dependent epimerase/dehydratase family protein [Edaphobacter flagellatus]|uniref:NAD-dependent epimerase/dehydratase family protein n=1 Tax=Edaphobacter flagellatus TaxID=1933044 RepID=UPI0036F293CE